MTNITKKIAPGAATPGANRAVNAKHIDSSLTHNSEYVKAKQLEEASLLFAQLSPRKQQYFIDWMGLYFKNSAFKQEFDRRFKEDLRGADFQEVCKFVDGWKKATEKPGE